MAIMKNRNLKVIAQSGYGKALEVVQDILDKKKFAHFFAEFRTGHMILLY